MLRSIPILLLLLSGGGCALLNPPDVPQGELPVVTKAEDLAGLVGKRCTIRGKTQDGRNVKAAPMLIGPDFVIQIDTKNWPDDKEVVVTGTLGWRPEIAFTPVPGVTLQQPTAAMFTMKDPTWHLAD